VVSVCISTLENSPRVYVCTHCDSGAKSFYLASIQVIEEGSALRCSVINLAETMAASAMSSDQLRGGIMAFKDKEASYFGDEGEMF